MPITPKQIEARRKHIGSSDVAAILGVDPWKNSYDVWLDKTGRLEDREPNDAMKAGSRLERSVLAFAHEHLGALVRNQYRSMPEAFLGANIDALVKADGTPVEAKTSGITSGYASDEWGEPGTDQCPKHVIVQAHCHMLVTDADHCHVPALLGGRGFNMYLVERDRGLCEIIVEFCRDFWLQNVQADTPPENVVPSLDLLKRVRREPASCVPISGDLVADWLAKKELSRQAAESAEQSAAALLAAMGDAEAGDAGEAGLVTYFEQTRKAYTVKESTYRALRLKKPAVNKKEIVPL